MCNKSGLLFNVRLILAFVIALLISSSLPGAVYAANIDVSGPITTNTTWTAGNVYVIRDHITVNSGVTLTIQAGTIVKFAGNKLLGVNGVLKVQGTADNPVTITSLKDDTIGGDTNGDGNATAPAAGDWGHIGFFDPSVDAENLIEYAILRYGGAYNNSGCQYYGCGAPSYAGVVRFNAASPTIRNNIISQNANYALSGSIDSFPVVNGNALTLNQGNGLEIQGGTLSAPSPIIRHWSNTDIVYAVTDNMTVASGVTLALDPGVKVKFAGNKLLGVNGVLKVQGTADNPVTITSLKDDTVGGDTNGDGNATAPAAGDWGHIGFFDPSVDAENLIEYAILRYGGAYNNSGCQYYGCGAPSYPGVVRFHAASPTIRNNIITRNKGYALSASIESFPIISSNLLSLNEGNGLELRGGTLSAPSPIIRHWSNTDIVYAVTDNMTVASGVTLALDPGVKVKFAGNKLLGVNGVLKVQGTADNPVTITSLKDDTVGGDTNGDGNATAPAAGDWGHIGFFDPSVDAENLIEYAILRYGGAYNNSGCQYYGCGAPSYPGVVRFHAASPTIRNNIISQNANYALSGSIDSFPVVNGNALTLNQGNGLEIQGGTLSAPSPIIRHWSNTDIVYAVTDNMTVASGVTLALDPGVKVKFAGNKLLGVNGVLKVQGTADNPVTITSLKDDTVGGDTNGDGNATAPAAGDWGHIGFFDPSVDAENLIEYAILRYGGAYNNSGCQYYGCGAPSYPGVVRFHAASPTIRNNIITRNNNGIWASGDSLPFVTGNAIFRNEGYGFFNESKPLVVSAKNNWWGDESGPLDPSDDADDSTHLHNPNGKGDKVGDYINYEPWQNAPLSQQYIRVGDTIFPPNYNGDIQITIAGGTPLNLAIPFDCSPTAVKVTFAGNTFDLADPDHDSVWTGTIIGATVGRETLPVTITATGGTCDGSAKEVAKVTLIDPSGYVYNSITKSRVADATVTLYYYDTDQKKYLVWDAFVFDQVNPQQTNAEGRYGWDVPAGSYYITVQKAGYKDYQSSPVTVPPAVTDLNIPLVSTETSQTFVVYLPVLRH